MNSVGCSVDVYCLMIIFLIFNFSEEADVRVDISASMRIMSSQMSISCH